MTGYTRKDTSNNIADGNIINADDLDNEFDGVQSAFNATTGHTHDGTAAEGAPITKIGPVQDVIASASAIYPKTTNTVDLGTSSLKYKDAFLAGSASVGGALAVAGTTTLTSQPILSSLTASSAVATDASKGLVSVTNTGTGNNVLATSPTLVTPILGTPTSVTLTNATGLPISTGVSGLGTGVATALAVNVGTAGAPVVNGGVLGTPSSGTVTNLTGTASININGTVGATTPTTGAFTTLTATGAVSSANVQVSASGSNAFVRVTSTSTNQNFQLYSQDPNSGNRNWVIVGSNVAYGDLNFKVSTTQGGDPLSAGTVVASLSSTGLAVTGGISATGAVTLSGGTANGVAYLDGSKVLTTGSALTFDGANFATSSGMISAGSGQFSAGLTGLNSVFVEGTQHIFRRGSAGSYTTVFTLDPSGNAIFAPGGTEAMRLNSTGLGIGTSSPGAKLDVNGLTTTSALRSTGGTAALYAVSSYLLGNTAAAGGFRLAAGLNVTFDGTNWRTGTDGGSNGGAAILSAYGSGNLEFHTVANNGATGQTISNASMVAKMTLDSSGNLGIGTTSPGYKLDVVGALNLQGSATFPTTGMFLRSADNQLKIIGGSAGINFGAASGASTYALIDASGNLGLGVTPSAWSGSKGFDIGSRSAVYENSGNNATGIANNLYIGSGGYTYKASAPASALQLLGSVFYWYQAASGTAGTVATLTQAMTLDASGNLLVGTTSANANGGVLQLKSGITFPATQVASSDVNTLDDYEEGVCSLTLAASTGSITTSSIVGTYTKIGRSVTLAINFTITTNGTGAGVLQISGLPFAGNQTTVTYYAVTGSNRTDAIALAPEYNPGSGFINVYRYDGTYPGASGKTYILSLTYNV